MRKATYRRVPIYLGVPLYTYKTESSQWTVPHGRSRLFFTTVQCTQIEAGMELGSRSLWVFPFFFFFSIRMGILTLMLKSRFSWSIYPVRAVCRWFKAILSSFFPTVWCCCCLLHTRIWGGSLNASHQLPVLSVLTGPALKLGTTPMSVRWCADS